LAVMSLLDQRDMYGYELVEALDRTSGGLLAPGQSTLYPLLYNLEGKGQLEAYWRVAPETGRRRKYYRLTGDGKRWLEAQRGQWTTLIEAMRRLGVGIAP
jgi:PadR family transcriptional regulator PadR